jgi:hypothetical protein
MTNKGAPFSESGGDGKDTGITESSGANEISKALCEMPKTEQDWSILPKSQTMYAGISYPPDSTPTKRSLAIATSVNSFYRENKESMPT